MGLRPWYLRTEKFCETKFLDLCIFLRFATGLRCIRGLMPAVLSQENIKMNEENTKKEEFKVSGEEVLKKVKELIKQGNIRRIIIKNEKGDTLMEIPLTFAVVGAVIAPVLAAVGALAALVTNCTIIVEKK